ncbi:MAG TPA: TIGR04282 family arsenosugar biosynthesis glycosyltransferase [Xanthobacteraceae bacterium]|nr:TIGR04282 family arsenosugar biosynthesis glycosyltransferase [Xanthobacteraceae bacterium]
MPGETPEPIGIAILAKAPLPGLVKTRLVPALGPQGAARLQRALVARTVETACSASTGPVTLWTSLDPDHEIFTALASRFDLRLARQNDGDLGARMLAAIAAGPTLVIGNDCPVLTPHHLREAAAALREGNDAVIIPAEDGGYVLIGLRQPQPALFCAMRWSVPTVLAETRRRLAQCGLRARELAALWDVDVPEDLDRLLQPGFEDLLAICGPHLVRRSVAVSA